MWHPEKQQLPKICQMSPINNEVITSPSFNSQSLVPKLETFKERWGWRNSRKHRRRAAIFIFSHIYISYIYLVSTSKMKHKRYLFICPEFLSVCYTAENRRTSVNEVATFPNGHVDVATHMNTVLCWAFTQNIEETARFPPFPDLRQWFELRSSCKNIPIVLKK